MATALTKQSIQEAFSVPAADTKAIVADIKKTLCSKADKQRAGKSLSAITFDCADGVLRLTFPHDILKAWFLENKASALNAIVRQHPAITGVEYATRTAGHLKPRPTPRQEAAHNNAPPRYSFDNFITNDKNDFPFTLCQAVAEQEKTDFNPLILYGKNGRGKTHLLKAILDKMGMAATHGFGGNINSLQTLLNRLKRDKFFSVVSTYRFLFLDDFHEIVDFPALQNELVPLFDTFVARQKQIVFSTSVPINDFTDILPQLKSRLLGGVIASLKKPDIDIKIRFVQRENKQRGLELNEEQIFYLVRLFDDFRSLEGCLLKIEAYKKLINSTFSQAQFKSIVSEIADRKQAPGPKNIIRATCEYYQVSEEDICSGKRQKAIAGARQVAIFLCRKHLGLSYPALGTLFGNKDHTTALYSYRKIEHRTKNDPALKKELGRIYAAAKN